MATIDNSGQVTVEDMIGWLEEDGFYRGIVGWKSDWSREEVYGPPPCEPLVLGFMPVAGNRQRETTPQRDFDVNAAFRTLAEIDNDKKFIRQRIRENKSLIPAAIRKIDRRLLKAGLSSESLQCLNTGHATDAYPKLKKLGELTDPPPPPPRIRFQVVSDMRPGRLDKVNIYLWNDCTLEDFEDSMANHRLIRDLIIGQWDVPSRSHGDEGKLTNGLDSNISPNPVHVGMTGEHSPEQGRNVWMYQVATGHGQHGHQDPTTGGDWQTIRDQDDFGKLVRELVKDGSKVAIICHVWQQEKILKTAKAPAQREVEVMVRESAVDPDWDDKDWDMDGLGSIPDDFDFSQLWAGYDKEAAVDLEASKQSPCPTTFSGEDSVEITFLVQNASRIFPPHPPPPPPPPRLLEVGSSSATAPASSVSMVNPGPNRDTAESESLSATRCPSSLNAPRVTAPNDASPPWVTAPTLLGSDPSLPSPQARLDANIVPRTMVSGTEHDAFTPEGIHPMYSASGNSIDEQHQDAATLQPFPSFDAQTDLRSLLSSSPMEGSGSETNLRQSISTNSLPRRTASIRAALAATLPSTGSVSPGSVISSPQLAAMGDITPLPSPIQRGVSSWRIGRTPSQSLSRASSTTSRSGSSFNLRSSDYSYPHRQAPSRSTPSHGPESTPDGESQQAHLTAPSDRKHARNRSLSEYVPDALPVSQKRQNSVSGSERPKSSASSHGANIHREQYLAVQRGIAIPASRPPTPPRSIRSGYESGDTPSEIISSATADRSQTFMVNSIRSKQPRQYRMLRQLGQGTFSQVVLAVRQEMDQHVDLSHPGINGVSPATQKLVAVKIVEYGPAGGADQERVEVSLKREVDILRSVNHPSLVQLKAFGSDEKRALLVLDFCPGGDLFEFASHGTKPLGAGLIRRIFSELVSAVRYLHENLIVHRDIKLENVLVNIPNLATIERSDWTRYDRAVVTLTDLGLSRRLPPPPESATLHTRCGSVDYAAPEILMGQGYDGRATDAWALGVLLYAIMEQRLPFDPLPGSRGDPAKLRQRTPHRIARCEWSWYRLADDQGEFDATKGRALEDAHDCVEALLRRSTKRKSLDEIADEQWVHDAIIVPSGLQRGDKEVP